MSLLDASQAHMGAYLTESLDQRLVAHLPAAIESLAEDRLNLCNTPTELRALVMQRAKDLAELAGNAAKQQR